MCAEWIWYPGEMEARWINNFNARRYERDVFIPPLWPAAGIFPVIKFAKKFVLKEEDCLAIRCDGKFNVELDGPGKYVYGFGGALRLLAGEHTVAVLVESENGRVPCLYVSGREVCSDTSWHCTCQDGTFVPAAAGGFFEPDVSPNDFRLPVRAVMPVACRHTENAVLYDFGEEMLAYAEFRGCNAKGRLCLYYGESEQEALDFAHCELTDTVECGNGNVRTEIPKAMRWLCVVGEQGARYESVCALAEYSPRTFVPVFETKDERLKKIWDVALHTVDLTTREFFMDGIKRDRWVWAGDSVQSILLNAYSFDDRATARRTLTGLAGKPPVRCHMNTIVDYTLLWLIGVKMYCEYTGDAAYARQIFPQLREIVRFVLSRTDSRGNLRFVPGDWIFIDWADGLPKDADGYAYLQILLFKALECASECAQTAEDAASAVEWKQLAAKVLAALRRDYWMEGRGCFAYARRGGDFYGPVCRQPNIMAVLCGAADKKQRAAIAANTYLWERSPAVKTPYMQFYELSALCELGRKEEVLHRIRTYFGGMLDLGAQTFWEYYDPAEKGEQHLSMYGRKYGKSLCHAWGGAPVYLLAKYFIGLRPEKGGCGFTVQPETGLLRDYTAVLPIPKGKLRIECADGALSVTADAPGTLIMRGRRIQIEPGVPLTVQSEKER